MNNSNKGTHMSIASHIYDDIIIKDEIFNDAYDLYPNANNINSTDMDSAIDYIMDMVENEIRKYTKSETTRQSVRNDLYEMIMAGLT
jgi:uncharacterized protein YegL